MIRWFERAVRGAVVLAAAAVMAACGSDSTSGDASFPARDGSAGEPNRIAAGELRAGAVHMDIPAGEFRALRLDMNALVGGLSGDAQFLVGSDPAATGRPWVGFTSAFVCEGFGPPQANSFIPAALGDGAPGAYAFRYSFSSNACGFEVVVVAGSNGGPARVSVGLVDALPPGYEADDPILALVTEEYEMVRTRADYAALVTGRPAVAASLQSGVGGRAGSFSRVYAPDGALLEFKAGEIDVMSDVMLAGPEATDVERRHVLSDAFEITGPGLVGWGIVGIPQAGAHFFDYALQTPAFSRVRSGGGATVSGYGPRTATSTGSNDVAVGGPLLTIASGAAMPGAGQYRLDYRLTGRQGGGVGGLGTGAMSAAAPSFLLVQWGYVPLDVNRLYGWEVAPIEFL